MARGQDLDPAELATRASGGEERALARLITGLEAGEPWAARALGLLRRKAAASGEAPRARILGVTGAPGAGKSTLVDKLIAAYRGSGLRVGVLAVDPSSPFSGGAILGDRVRMRSSGKGGRVDEGVFIRSLASRGRLGGLSRATGQGARALEAAGYGVVLVETVGIGQSEVDVARLADLVILVSMPGSGDDIQTIKAGVMEIGDLFVVNKADRDGADKLEREIRAALELSPEAGPIPPILKTVAETGEGVAKLRAEIDRLWERLLASGELEARRMRGAKAEARALVGELLAAGLDELEGELEDSLAEQVARGELEAAEAAATIFEALRRKTE